MWNDTCATRVHFSIVFFFFCFSFFHSIDLYIFIVCFSLSRYYFCSPIVFSQLWVFLIVRETIALMCAKIDTQYKKSVEVRMYIRGQQWILECTLHIAQSERIESIVFTECAIDFTMLNAMSCRCIFLLLDCQASSHWCRWENEEEMICSNCSIEFTDIQRKQQLWCNFAVLLVTFIPTHDTGHMANGNTVVRT